MTHVTHVTHVCLAYFWSDQGGNINKGRQRSQQPASKDNEMGHTHELRVLQEVGQTQGAVPQREEHAGYKSKHSGRWQRSGNEEGTGSDAAARLGRAH